MYVAVITLAVLIILLLCVKMSFLGLYPCLSMALLFAVFTGLSWPVAIRQSSLGIAAWMNDPALMLDTAVVLSVEVLLQIVYCLLSTELMYGGSRKKAVLILHGLLQYFPGILCFPVVLFMLMRSIYLFPGVSFAKVAWIMAAIVFIIIAAVAIGVKKIIPEKEIRLELLFLLALLELVLGVITTVNGTTSFKGSDPVSWGALAYFAAIASICAAVGYLSRNKKTKKHGIDF